MASPEVKEVEPFKLQAVIFDKDGVLIDTELVYMRAVNETLQHFGSSLKYTEEHRRRHAGKSSMVTLNLIRREFGVETELDELVNYYRCVYRGLFEKEGIPVPRGVRELIADLKREGIKVAVGTGGSGENVMFTLKTAGLGAEFDAIVTADDVVNGKPGPDIFLLAAQRLQVSPNSCVVIGDSHNDRIAAKKAGMKFVLLSPKMEDTDIKDGLLPDLVVQTLEWLGVDQLRKLWL